ncbi:MAG TPA: 2TM domain-containing protein [Miltoncostaeaceae bacterium]|nr:2TM domain-containing protein [Miltoncostaeaceae bacterium]
MSTTETTRPPTRTEEEQALRALAVQQVERIHAFRRHLISYAIGVVGLGLIWMLTEYFQDNEWPSRFADADEGRPDTWNPWYFYAVAIWTVIICVHAAKTYGRRPPTEEEIQREMDRMDARR